ncbi:hypothetical protein FB451DRAFT_1442816 [Mycena latifolia]|nr:hypothetical protein FB451DRAFT_1442816 [Mycena latifolia]
MDSAAVPQRQRVSSTRRTWTRGRPVELAAVRHLLNWTLDLHPSPVLTTLKHPPTPASTPRSRTPLATVLSTHHQLIALLKYQNRYYHAPPVGSSPNPFQSTNMAPAMSNPSDWDRALTNNELFALPPGGAVPSEGTALPYTFNPEEEDEMFGDPDADFPDPNVLLAAGNVGPTPAAAEPTLPARGPSPTGSGTNPQLSTPQNLRVFPRATSSMSSTSVELAPRRLIRRVWPSTSISSGPTQSPAPQPSSARLPLVRRTNIFGLGLHDDRQRPRQSPPIVQAVDKENAVHRLSSDDEEPSAPPKKKSHQEPAARSIINVAGERIPVIAAGYTYIRLKVMTNESKTWLNQRPALAAFSQDAFNYGADQLRLNRQDYSPVLPIEQDLFRERIYGTRWDFKEVAREVVKGPDGYDFRRCASNASKADQDIVAAHNRALVAVLLDKSAFVFTDPMDRTVKGTLYGHASIQAAINKAAFDGLLSDAMQHPEYFDDTLPATHDLEDDTQPPHKPTFSLVPIAGVITAIRASIMEYSSGHFVAETYSRKIFKAHFEAELKTLRAWREFTSRPTTIQGNGPVRTTAPSFLARTFQENIFAIGRYSVLKDVVAPVVAVAVMDESDFANNQ